MLSRDQLREFGDRGYLILRGVVPERQLAPVDAEIGALVAGSPPPSALLLFRGATRRGLAPPRVVLFPGGSPPRSATMAWATAARRGRPERCGRARSRSQESWADEADPRPADPHRTRRDLGEPAVGMVVDEEGFRDSRTSEPPGEQLIGLAIIQVIILSRALGLLAADGWFEHRYELTSVGKATALEALRARATGPKTIPWP